MSSEPVVRASRASPRSDSVLSKMHLIFGAFTDEQPVLGLSELSRRAGISKASVYRLSGELVELGYLAKTQAGYQLGWRLFDFGRRVPGLASLRDVARPLLQDLRATTRAVVMLSVRHGDECFFLERIVGRSERPIIDAVEDRLPLRTSASGRVLLAFSDSPDVEARSAWMTTVRRQRFAEERSRLFPGYRAVAVPVMYAGDGRALAAISTTVPMDRRDTQQLLHALWATSAEITKGLAAPRRALTFDPEDDHTTGA